MGAKTTWTAKQDAELMRLWPTKSAREIGAILGTTRNAVIGRLHRIRGDYADYISPTTQELRAEREVARKKIDRYEAAIIERLIRNDLPRNAVIVQAASANVRQRVVGEAFGITRSRVGQIIGGR